MSESDRETSIMRRPWPAGGEGMLHHEGDMEFYKYNRKFVFETLTLRQIDNIKGDR